MTCKRISDLASSLIRVLADFVIPEPVPTCEPEAAPSEDFPNDLPFDDLPAHEEASRATEEAAPAAEEPGSELPAMPSREDEPVKAEHCSNTVYTNLATPTRRQVSATMHRCFKPDPTGASHFQMTKVYELVRLELLKQGLRPLTRQGCRHHLYRNGFQIARAKVEGYFNPTSCLIATLREEPEA